MHTGFTQEIHVALPRRTKYGNAFYNTPLLSYVMLRNGTYPDIFISEITTRRAKQDFRGGSVMKTWIYLAELPLSVTYSHNITQSDLWLLRRCTVWQRSISKSPVKRMKITVWLIRRLFPPKVINNHATSRFMDENRRYLAQPSVLLPR